MKSLRFVATWYSSESSVKEETDESRNTKVVIVKHVLLLRDHLREGREITDQRVEEI